MQDDFNRLAGFLARRDVDALSLTALQGPVDVILLLGSSLVRTAQTAAEAFHAGVAPHLLVSGGIGHSTPDLWANVARTPRVASIPAEGLPESDILADILIQVFEIPRAAISIENRSTNCGSNAWESKRQLAEMGLHPRSVILIQDPTMQRRSHASFERAWRGEASPRWISFAPFIPEVVDHDDGPQLTPETREWTMARFTSLLTGEIPRLLDTPEGYGPQGRDFIEHVEIPEEVLDAYIRIRQAVEPEWAGSRQLGGAKE